MRSGAGLGLPLKPPARAEDIDNCLAYGVDPAVQATIYRVQPHSARQHGTYVHH